MDMERLLVERPESRRRELPRGAEPMDMDLALAKDVHGPRRDARDGSEKRDVDVLLRHLADRGPLDPSCARNATQMDSPLA